MGLHPPDLIPSPEAPSPNTIARDLWGNTDIFDPYRGHVHDRVLVFWTVPSDSIDLEISSLLPSCREIKGAVQVGAPQRSASQAVPTGGLKTWVK